MRILIVEDNDFRFERIIELLPEGVGYDRAIHYDAAITFLRDQHYAWVFLDHDYDPEIKNGTDVVTTWIQNKDAYVCKPKDVHVVIHSMNIAKAEHMYQLCRGQVRSCKLLPFNQLIKKGLLFKSF